MICGSLLVLGHIRGVCRRRVMASALMPEEETVEVVVGADSEFDDHSLVLPVMGLAALLWALFSALCGLPSLLGAVVTRFRRWELLHAPERSLDFTLLGLPRKFVIRQAFTGRCAPSAEGLGTGGALWGGALELSSWLLNGMPGAELAGGAVSTKGGRCVELGAGLGLVSMLVALMPLGPPQELFLTDGHPPVLAAAQAHLVENLSQAEIEAAGLSARVACWGDAKDVQGLLTAGRGGAFDFIFGADVVYYPAPLPLLLETILALCGERTRVVIAYTPRGNIVARRNCDAFFDDLGKCFDHMRCIEAVESSLAQLQRAGLASDLLSGGDASEVGTASVRVYSGFRQDSAMAVDTS